jgi:hypothetical protein
VLKRPIKWIKSLSYLGVFVLAATAAMLAIVSAAQAAVPPTVNEVPQKMPTFNGGIYAMAYDGNTIYVGGKFTQVNYSGQKWNRGGLAAIDASTGALLPWAPTANGEIDAMAVDLATHNVYVAGAFTMINTTKRDSLAEINGSSGAVGPFKHSIFGAPEALAIAHGLIYLGGHITQVDGAVRANLAAFSLSSGALSNNWAPTTDDIVYSIMPDNGRIYIGGKFHKINGISGSGKLAAVDPFTGVRDSAFKPVVSIIVYAIALTPGGIVAAEGGQGGRAIEYSSAGTPIWTFTSDGDVHAVAYLGGILYIGGHFDNACVSSTTGTHGTCVDGSLPRVKFAAVDASSGTLTDWDPTGNGVHGVFTMLSNTSLGTIAAGGEFTTVGGVSRGRFAQFH